MLLTSVTPTNLIFKKENHKREKKHFQYLLKKKSMYKWTLAVQTRVVQGSAVLTFVPNHGWSSVMC